VMKLLLQRPGSALLGGLKYYPTRISWSKVIVTLLSVTQTVL
jgi:hypothetical protein